MTDQPVTAQCPACQAALKKVPQRKTKCPACGQFMFVKTLPTTRARVLVTEARALAIEAEWSSYLARERWVAELSTCGLTAQDYDREMADTTRSATESIYRLFDQALALNRGDWHMLSTIYHRLAFFAYESGGEFKPYLSQAAQMRLNEYRARGSRTVKILTSGQEACAACQSLHDKVYSIDEALAKMPIPCDRCTTWDSGFCRCQYVSVTARQASGPRD